MDMPYSSGLKFAKLSRPDFTAVLPRVRLNTLLDDLRRIHRVIWIHSPPGSGKTTLAAAYLAQSRESSVWYRMDCADKNPATLLSYLAYAITPPEIQRCLTPEESLSELSAGLQRGRLPDPIDELPDGGMEASEHPPAPHDFRQFARLHFRDFFSRLPAGSIVVLDNLQEFNGSSSSELLDIAFSEVPDQITVLAISRDLPPLRLARMELSGVLVTIGWEALRFTPEEARDLAQTACHFASAAPDWHALADGWAAGIIFLRTQANPLTGELGGNALREAKENIFRYLEAEVLEVMPPAIRRWLLEVSCLPGITENDAADLTNNPKAGILLAQLYRNRYFLSRDDGDALTYRFHFLFQEYLDRERQRTLGPGELAILLERAAIILDRRNLTDHAAGLYRDAGAHASLADLLLRRAPEMMSTGQENKWRLWREWIPSHITDKHPWLWYWLGFSLNRTNPREALDILVHAERAFREKQDMRACLITQAAIIENIVLYQGLAEVTALRPWTIAMSESLARIDPGGLPADVDLRIHSRFLIALIFDDPGSPAIPVCVERTVRALAQAGDIEGKLTAGTALLSCMHWIDTGAASFVIGAVRQLADHPSISPDIRVWWLLQCARWTFDMEGDTRGALRLNELATAAAVDTRLDHMRFHLSFSKALILIGSGDLAGAKALVDQLRTLLAPARRIDVFRFAMLEALILHSTGNTQAALRTAHEAFAIEGGCVSAEQARFYRMLAGFHAQNEEFDQADAWCKKAVDHSFAWDRKTSLQFQQFITSHALAARGERDAATEMLRATFSSHRQQRTHAFLVRLPQLAGKLAARALKDGTEVEHVRNIIRRQQLLPPDRHAAGWPWPVAIRTLGKFELSLNGDRVKFSGKAQHRPLTLLKALMIGGDAGKLQGALANQLWPEVEFAKSAVNVTIHRLRKLLGSDAAVVVANGVVSLDAKLVWSDTQALGAQTHEIESLRDDACLSRIADLTVALLDLYRGPFCDGEEESWLLPARERLRSQFLAAASRLGQLLEAQKQWTLANSVYVRALAAEPLAEANYRGMMRCAHAQNDPAAAFSAYRHCRDTLSIVLGQQPSPETDRLAVSLGLIH